MKRRAFIRLHDAAVGYREEAIWVVGESGSNYEIETDKTLKLEGKRILEPGQTMVIAKNAITLSEEGGR